MPTLHKFIIEHLPCYIYWSTYEEEDQRIANPDNDDDIKEFLQDLRGLSLEWKKYDNEWCCEYGSHYGYVRFMGDWSNSKHQDLMKCLNEEFLV